MATVATLRDLIEALIESAKGEGKLDKVISDLEGFFRILSSHEELKNILGSSVYGDDEREGIITDVGAKAGFDKLTVNFLNLAVELDKLEALIKSEEAFMRRLRKASGRVRAEIILANKPEETDLERIKKTLKKLVEQKDIEISVKIDPEILGGVIAKIEDKIFDGSVKTQLERMRNVLSAA